MSADTCNSLFSPCSPPPSQPSLPSLPLFPPYLSWSSGDPKSSVTAHLNHDTGILTASIHTVEDHYYIEPSHRHFRQAHDFHMISYRVSDLKFNLTRYDSYQTIATLPADTTREFYRVWTHPLMSGRVHVDSLNPEICCPTLCGNVNHILQFMLWWLFTDPGSLHCHVTFCRCHVTRLTTHFISAVIPLSTSVATQSTVQRPPLQAPPILNTTCINGAVLPRQRRGESKWLRLTVDVWSVKPVTQSALSLTVYVRCI